jgi:hypothetical protein
MKERLKHDCGSNKIIFSNEDFEFEVSNSTFKRNIIADQLKITFQ